MLYGELQVRYGNHIAKRVERELSRSEFSAADLNDLPHFLEKRAEKAAENYRQIMANPLERGTMQCESLQRLWREAEDLAYLLSIAEDVSITVRASMAGG